MLDPEDFHHFVTQMVDNFYGNAAVLGFLEGPRGVTAQCLPCFGVDLRFQARFERVVGIIGTKEVSMTNEEALLVVVGVDEPAGDTVRSVADNFSGLWLEDINAFNLHSYRSVLLGQ